MKTRPTLLTVLIVSMVFAGALGTWATATDTRTAFSPAPGEPTLDEVRRATERFRDVNVALAEGYIRDPFDLCDTAEMMGRPASLGAMGVHSSVRISWALRLRPPRASMVLARTWIF